jgi:CheY-like chemotaxis protein
LASLDADGEFWLRTVLLVEDDALVRLAVAMFLEDEGFIVTEAQSADEAVRILETRKDIENLVTDIDMPGSVNGVTLAQQFAAEFPQSRIVVVSGAARAGLKLPPSATFLQKPFSERALVSALE